jgi:hypothetical protein
MQLQQPWQNDKILATPAADFFFWKKNSKEVPSIMGLSQLYWSL